MMEYPLQFDQQVSDAFVQVLRPFQLIALICVITLVSHIP